jgi:hypothetical protein
MPSNPDPSNSGKFAPARFKPEAAASEGERSKAGRPIDPPSLPPWSRPPEPRADAPARAAPAPAKPPGRAPIANGRPTVGASRITPSPVGHSLPPPLSRGPVAVRSAPPGDEDTPTLEQLEGHGDPNGPTTEELPPWELPVPQPGAPHVSPRELARRLAEDARKRATPGPAPEASPRPPTPAPSPSGHEALADGPVTEKVSFVPAAPPQASAPPARQTTSPPPKEDPVRPDDPRELARRLAEEAKKRMANPRSGEKSAAAFPVTDPEPTSWETRSPSAPVPEFERITDPGPAPYGLGAPEPTDDTVHGGSGSAAADAQPDEEPYDPGAYDPGAYDPGPDEPYDPDPEPPPDLPTQFAKGRSLAERAAPVKSAPVRMTASEALAAARLAEAEAEAGQRARASRPAPPPPKPAAPVSVPPQQAAPALAASRAAAPAPSGRLPDASLVFAELLPQAQIEAPIPVTQLDVFRALWRAHRARATHDGALELVATSSVLLSAVEHGARLAAARVTVNGVTWATWVDLDRRVLLGAARPAEVYLAGL